MYLKLKERLRSRRSLLRKNTNRPTVASLSVAFDDMQEQSAINSNDIRDIRVTLNSLESKFDKFLSSLELNNAATPRPQVNSRRRAPEVITVDHHASVRDQEPPHIVSTDSHPARDKSSSNQLPPFMPTPSQIVQEQNKDGFIDARMSREEYLAGQTNGKPG